MNWLYRRRGRQTTRIQAPHLFREFDSTVFVSKEEAELFRQAGPESALNATITHRASTAAISSTPGATIRTYPRHCTGAVPACIAQWTTSRTSMR